MIAAHAIVLGLVSITVSQTTQKLPGLNALCGASPAVAFRGTRSGRRYSAGNRSVLEERRFAGPEFDSVGLAARRCERAAHAVRVRRAWAGVAHRIVRVCSGYRGHPLAGPSQARERFHGGASRQSLPFYSVCSDVPRPFLQIMAANESRQPPIRIKRSAINCLRPGG